MIVDSMTFEEVVNEYKKDHKTAFDKITKWELNNQHKIRRVMIKKKPKSLYYVYSTTYKTKNHNNFIIEAYACNYSHWKKEGLLYSVIMDFQYHGGRNLLMAGCDNSEYIWICPHFIQRYNERFLNSNEANVEITFLHRNQHIVHVNNASENYKSSRFGYVNDGVVLGHYILPNTFFYGTFLNRNMLFDSQINISDEVYIDYKEYLKTDFRLDVEDINYQTPPKRA